MLVLETSHGGKDGSGSYCDDDSVGGGGGGDGDDYGMVVEVVVAVVLVKGRSGARKCA